MSHPADTRRHEQVHRLTLELQALRGRLNDTIDQLCELVAGHELGSEPVGLSPLAGHEQGSSERSLAPGWLRLPSSQASASNPPSGYRLGNETTVYSDYRNGFLQVIQVSQPRGADEHYALVVNHADFDGSFLSFVIDARALLADMPAGPARLSLAVEVRGTPMPGMNAKCAWKVGEHWSERTLRLQPGQLAADSLSVDMLDPSQINALDFHLFFNPVGRGSFEIRRLTAALVVTPASEAPVTSSVFETAP
ncbi:MAG TPA: DUF6478 family protein [Ideonella sp.]|jgi:hypothetical protein|uniref:DUF6478 family protein n=1 Tax=Ideonella sp. TaxID=1929293 RepID=UPI002E3358EC|nr:DUF6478 family protein [Ideonella sp.]HEX5687234.1 DUF6478 family protein [Ideonella sp.]